MKILKTSFNQNQSEKFYQVTHGIDCDPNLYKEEILVQKAWASGLVEVNILTPEEVSDIYKTLDSISEAIEQRTFRWETHDDDIHMNIERVVTECLGDLGKKMHLGRSRNDLIATTLKKYLANCSQSLAREIEYVVLALLQNSQRDLDCIAPSYTHAQAAQPIRMGLFWNYHALNFASDVKRFTHLQGTLMNVMPLGSGAISGTHLKMNLQSVASTLGFINPPLNSIHSVSDRDDAIEFAHAVSILALHVIKFCDDVIFWSSTPIGIIKLSPQWSSGSSMMPNKRNPDFYEILRAKFKLLSDVGSQVLRLSGGPISGYASDLHEQKKLLIVTINQLREVLPLLPEAFSSLEVDSSLAEQQLIKGNILATDLANKFVEEGLTFRDAYGKVAELVSASKVPRELEDFKNSVEKKDNRGGTSKNRVLETSNYIKQALLDLNH
jgi:argininosuccinate lyase